MRIEEVGGVVDGLPHMTRDQAREVTGLILENQSRDILELGCLHGVSTCYMAAAIDELGGGGITTIDLEVVRDLEPNVETLLERAGLDHLATIHYEPTSYNWRLMKMLEADPTPRFDLCYIDGAHSWYDDGFAFFLADRLLRPGGWMLFDDLHWSFAASPSVSKRDKVRQMPAEERETRQLVKVFELLVKPHPSYDRFMVKDGWGYAHKAQHAAGAAPAPRTEVVHHTEHVGLAGLAVRALRRVVGR